MFESAEIGHKLSKGEYKRIEPVLRAELLDTQYQLLKDAKVPVIVLISGVRGAGKGETVNLLNEWMDPRHIHTHAFDSPTDEERERPPMWRYWRALPPKGRIGILFGSWYTSPIIERVFKRASGSEMLRSIGEINRFEKMLADDGAVILKFWFHLSKKRQQKRLRELQANRETRWRITDRDWDFFKMYDRFYKVSEEALRESNTACAPWIVVEGSDPEYRAVTVGRTLLAAMKERLKNRPAPAATVAAPLQRPVDKRDLLSNLDLSLSVPKKRYEERLKKYQRELALLSRHPKFREHTVIAAFEGMDAAGKGSTIRRITVAMDARFYQVVPIAAPTEEERAQPYLWRFWRHVPAQGNAVIFDRSWYGRVLVERVEGFCREEDWMRAYHEINEFEEQLASGGAIVVKFWLAISPEEQLRRFNERADTPHKQFKITEEDWRNRKKWDEYQVAAADMIERTGTSYAPWTIVESNDKLHARIKIIKTLCERLEAALAA